MKNSSPFCSHIYLKSQTKTSLNLISEIALLSLFSKHFFRFFLCFFSGALPFVTASVFCLGGFLKWLTIISYCILCLWGLQKALTAGSPWQRRLCFALPFLMRVLLTILRISRFGGGNPTAMIHVFLQVRFETPFFVMHAWKKKRQGKKSIVRVMCRNRLVAVYPSLSWEFSSRKLR